MMMGWEGERVVLIFMNMRSELYVCMYDDENVYYDSYKYDI
jgi:hypothetical protein